MDVEAAAHGITHVPDHDIVPNFVDGWAFGNALGVGLRSSGGWSTITGVRIRDDSILKVRLIIHRPDIYFMLRLRL